MADPRKPIGSDDSAIPELDRNRPGITDDVQRMGANVVNMFSVERDTALADGAGTPGSTEVGGLRDDDDRRSEARDRGE